MWFSCRLRNPFVYGATLWVIPSHSSRSLLPIACCQACYATVFASRRSCTRYPYLHLYGFTRSPRIHVSYCFCHADAMFTPNSVASTLSPNSPPSSAKHDHTVRSWRICQKNTLKQARQCPTIALYPPSTFYQSRYRNLETRNTDPCAILPGMLPAAGATNAWEYRQPPSCLARWSNAIRPCCIPPTHGMTKSDISYGRLQLQRRVRAVSTPLSFLSLRIIAKRWICSTARY